MDGEGKRLNGIEQEGLYDLLAIVQLLEGCGKKFGKRLDGLRFGRRDYGLLKHYAAKLAMEIIATAPGRQRMAIARNLDSLCVSIGAKSPQGYRHDEYGRWISDAALQKVAEMCREHCMMCTMGSEWYKCGFRRAMDELPVDLPEDPTGCPYYTLWAGI